MAQWYGCYPCLGEPMMIVGTTTVTGNGKRITALICCHVIVDSAWRSRDSLPYHRPGINR